MVLKKSIYYGRFDGFQSTVVPKAPRSLRRSSIRKLSEGKLCAFDLLAAVADKLLQESESSTSSITPERKGQISVNAKDFVKQEEPEVTESTNLEWNLEPPTIKSPESDDDSGLEHVSDVRTSGFLKKVGNNVKLEPSEGENVDKLEGNAPDHGGICDFNLVNNIAEIQTEPLGKQSGNLTFRDPAESCVNTRVLNKSYSSVHLPFYKDPVSCFTRRGGNVKMSIIDNDESSFRYNQHGTKKRAFRSQSHAGYRRIGKMLTSRYRKVMPKKDDEVTNSTSGKYAEAGSKRRKLFHHSSNNASNNVKLSIKSFEVPELYVEIPETATVGSLKRTVMEAITAILVGGLHVGILVDGKKVRDNNRTLQQMGISQNCDLETLGFTLEPRFPHAFPCPIQKEPPLAILCDTSLQQSRSEGSPIMDVGFSNSSLDLPPASNNNHENIALQSEVLTEERVADSKAIVKAEALSIVPVDHKPTKSCEVSQRRTRRPFSVSEVEALVEAVETLGTGRWRDVKLRSFDDANHRTYVDLKDKWKTLVHTASISPQQRRGEAVPQDLLDRVLAAHAYWSQWKHQTQPQCSSLDFVGI
ncbi:telomere repeat-binding protein 3-like [Cynara cardunculus var. scolymus]|uniref:Homeodomain-like protein n=1 Tax=Cynara cardunculus var. scolymus TaxID=59895 RepID=A0A103YD85_CYNCS|nr:telomere repeat-binding protein 3-like [Cynara cardunculus var. scolymus]KVI06954.1 Homeodomain-like protein [Cynara cardunculus var. scolymus]